MRNVHLVGSVPLASAREVFETVSAVLGPRLKRIPDGETRERSDWVFWLEPVFARHPALEPSGTLFYVHANAKGRMRYRLKPGYSAKDITFDNLFYAEVAIASFKEFERLQEAGRIPAGCRFQVDLVPAHSVLWLFLQDELHEAVDPVFNGAVRREIDKLAAAIPHEKLSIQFDVASAVFARLQRNEPSAYGKDKQQMMATFAGILTRLGDHVPTDIELMFHFCYGDNNHRHAVEPIDMGAMVDLANRLTHEMARPINLIHMPVPRDRSDDAYFAPLKRLQIKPETELSLGLVHYTDGVAGTRRRLATAERFVRDFSIATECGFGRRPPETIPQLLQIHAEVAG
jgi:hypothetical protein